MKFIIFSFLSLLFITNSAFANCQWTYLNQLNKDIKYAQDLLSDYSTCRTNCKGLEVGLNSSLVKMSQTASCGKHIVTASNAETINFIGGRFKLIQKQKTASTWAAGGPKNRVTATVSSPQRSAIPSIAMATPAFVKPSVQRTVQRRVVPLPERAAEARPTETRQTKMVISKDAYNELWDVNTASAAQRTAQLNRNNAQQAAKRQRQVALRAQQNQANIKARQYHLAQQRLDRHLKMALIQEEKIKLVKSKRRDMQNRLHKQRLVRQQYLKKRAMAIRVNRQKVHQQRMARAKKLRRR